MSETSRRILYLTVEGFPAERLAELSASTTDSTEIFALTEASAREALEKIFAADTVAVWGSIAST